MKIFSIFLSSFVLLAVALPVAAQNYSGTWLATVNDSVSWCKNLGKTEPGDYKLTIVHKGNDITLLENVVQRPYKGIIDPKRPLNLHVNGSYVKDGGYVNEMIDIGFENDSTGMGGSVWQWSDGYFQCGGRFKFDLKRIRR
jgi:hypothetical protein